MSWLEREDVPSGAGRMGAGDFVDGGEDVGGGCLCGQTEWARGVELSCERERGAHRGRGGRGHLRRGGGGTGRLRGRMGLLSRGVVRSSIGDYLFVLGLNLISGPVSCSAVRTRGASGSR